MCIQTEQALTIRQISSSQNSMIYPSSQQDDVLTCSSSTSMMFSPGSFSRRSQDADLSLLHHQSQHSNNSTSKRTRDDCDDDSSYCFLDVSEYKSPCCSSLYSADTIDILASRFSQLGRQDSAQSVSTTDTTLSCSSSSEEEDDEGSTSTTPRKRQCRGLVRTKKSTNLLEELADEADVSPASSFDW